MSAIMAFAERLTADGKITFDEVAAIKQQIAADGKLDHEDVKLLVGVAASCKEVCPEFDAIFFPALKEVLLADGQITPDEQYYLMKMLWGDGRVRPVERKFIQELRAAVKDPSPEFVELCDSALASPETDWDLGGRSRGH
jgi:hypothetical protein